MKTAYLICTIACFSLLTIAAAGEKPSLEIVSPQTGGEYDGGLKVVLWLRNLPQRRLLVNIHLGEITHAFVVDPHLDPPRPVYSPAGPPAWSVEDSWLYFEPGPQRIEVVAFHSDQPEEELFRQSVAFEIKPASLEDMPAMRGLHGRAGLHGCSQVMALERVVFEWRAASLHEPAARAALEDLKDRLHHARLSAWSDYSYALRMLHAYYMRALQYDKALGVLQRGEQFAARVDEQMRGYSGPAAAKGRRAWEGTRASFLRAVTDMYARLGRLDETIEGCRREIEHAEAQLERESDTESPHWWQYDLLEGHRRKALFHMLLAGDEEAYNKWQARTRELRAQSQK